MTFQEYLDSRNIDQQDLTPELAAALVAQWQESQPEPIRSLILIPETVDGRWATALRVETCSQ